MSLSLVAQLPVAARPGEYVGACPEMREVYRKLDKIAPTGISVLLAGETGAAKDLSVDPRTIFRHLKRCRRQDGEKTHPEGEARQEGGGGGEARADGESRGVTPEVRW